ncbi:hypothetical protein PRVXH_002123 [Proteinivorax hydrogeniformans]|uniref:Phage holin family protein n=1 Tax=Proteinivorax hydrogeniformans TaxID=1826727 RepID=A0AAU8HRJ7_9FIRM
MGRVFFKGREVTNPVIKGLLILLGLGIAAFILTVVFLIVGVIVTVSVGIGLFIAAFTLLLVTFVILKTTIFSFLSLPFKAIANLFGGDNDDPWDD